MFTDALLQLSTGQAVTGTAFSTNTIDLSNNRDLGAGESLGAIFTVDTSASAVSAATVAFQVVTSASPDLSSPTVLTQTDAISKAELTAARRPFSVPVPSSMIQSVSLGQRYLGVRYVVGSGPLLSGAFSAVISTSRADVGKFHGSAVPVY